MRRSRQWTRWGAFVAELPVNPVTLAVLCSFCNPKWCLVAVLQAVHFAGVLKLPEPPTQAPKFAAEVTPPEAVKDEAWVAGGVAFSKHMAL